jgi:hypothetical protein
MDHSANTSHRLFGCYSIPSGRKKVGQVGLAGLGFLFKADPVDIIGTKGYLISQFIIKCQFRGDPSLDINLLHTYPVYLDGLPQEENGGLMNSHDQLKFFGQDQFISPDKDERPGLQSVQVKPELVRPLTGRRAGSGRRSSKARM